MCIRDRCKLKVADLHPREGVLHLKVNGKGGKIRFLPVAFEAARRIDAYLRAVCLLYTSKLKRLGQLF